MSLELEQQMTLESMTEQTKAVLGEDIDESDIPALYREEKSLIDMVKELCALAEQNAEISREMLGL
jgi:hypothetical protein